MILDPLEFTSLLMRFAFAIASILNAGVFFLKVKRAKGSMFDFSSFFGLGIFALLGGIAEIYFTYYYYYIFVFNQELFDIYTYATYVGYLGVIGIIFLSEKMFGKTKYVFTISCIISFICAIFFVNSIEELRVYTTIMLPTSGLIVFINFGYSMVFKTTGEIRKKMRNVFIGFLTFMIFYMLDSELVKNSFPIHPQITTIIAMLGLIVIISWWAYIFLSFETFTEFGWREKLKELYIIAPNGGTLFHYSFEKGTPEKTPDLVSAGLTGFKDVIAEIIQSRQNLKVMDHQDVKIIFEYGNYSTLALIAYENLKIYQSKLDSLIKQFENLFQDVLSDWKGETEVFLPSKRLIEEIFG